MAWPLAGLPPLPGVSLMSPEEDAFFHIDREDRFSGCWAFSSLTLGATLPVGGQRGRGVVGSSGLRARASPQPPSQGDNEVRGDGGLMGLCLWGREGGVPRPLQEMGTSPGHQAPASQWVWHLPI